MRDFILNALSEMQNEYYLCGFVVRRARIYPLGSDTKVISFLFESVARHAVLSYAGRSGMLMVEPAKQNHYPDFTLRSVEQCRKKIAIDVKTTYRREGQARFALYIGKLHKLHAPPD